VGGRSGGGTLSPLMISVKARPATAGTRGIVWYYARRAGRTGPRASATARPRIVPPGARMPRAMISEHQGIKAARMMHQRNRPSRMPRNIMRKFSRRGRTNSEK
jgi:hypothetical protein